MDPEIIATKVKEASNTFIGKNWQQIWVEIMIYKGYE